MDINHCNSNFTQYHMDITWISPNITQYHMYISEYHSNIKQYQPQSPNIIKYHPIHMDISKYHSNKGEPVCIWVCKVAVAFDAQKLAQPWRRGQSLGRISA